MSAQSELLAWLNGTVNGGPQGDGRYPLTFADGEVHLIYCPAAQALDPTTGEGAVEIFLQQAQAAAAEAALHASSADASRIASAADAANASGSASTANSHRALAQKWASAEPGVEVIPGYYSAKHWAMQVAGTINAAGTTFTGSSIPAGVTPQHGDRWLHTSGAMLTFINDGNSGQWAELGPAQYVSSGGTLTAIDGGSY